MGPPEEIVGLISHTEAVPSYPYGMTSISVKQAVTGALLALEALATPSRAPAQDGSTKTDPSPHSALVTKTGSSIQWNKDWARQERLLAEAIEPGMREGLGAIGLGERPVRVALVPHAIESGTIRADGTIVLNAERLRTVISTLVQSGIAEKPAARLVGIVASETVAHEQRHIDDTNTLRAAVGKDIMIGSIELEVLGHRAGAMATRKLRESGLMKELIEAGKRCPDFAVQIQTILSWESRASLPASAYIHHLRGMVGYRSMPSIFDRDSLLAAGKRSLEEAEFSVRLNPGPESNAMRASEQRSLESVSDPHTLLKLQNTIQRLLAEDAASCVTTLPEGRSVSGALLLAAGDDLKRSRELGFSFYPFVSPWALCNLVNSLNASERESFATHRDVRALLEVTYQQCAEDLGGGKPVFGLIAPYIALGDVLGKSFEERASLLNTVICTAWHLTDEAHRNTPASLESLRADFQRALDRNLAPAIQFLERDRATK